MVKLPAVLFFKKKSPKAEIVKTWRSEIRQSVGNSGSTKEARRKRRIKRFKDFLLVLSFTLLVAFVMFLSGRINASEFKKVHHVNKVQLVTDGALTEGWLLNYTELNYSNLVVTKSVFDIKKHLLEYPQILSAEVSRSEEKLVVSIRERRAVARVKTDGGEIKMVAPDGVLFPAGTYFTANVDALPFVEDFELAENEKGFQILQKHKALVAFLDAVRTVNPRLLVEWESVSLKHIPLKMLSMRYDQPWAYFVVKPARGRTDADLPPVEEMNFSAMRYPDELNLWCSADTQSRLKNYFAQNPESFRSFWKISFVLNTKDMNNQFIEARVIPTRAVPAAEHAELVRRPVTPASAPAAGTRAAQPVIRRPVRPPAQNPRQSPPSRNIPANNGGNGGRSDGKPANKVNPRYQNH